MVPGMSNGADVTVEDLQSHGFRVTENREDEEFGEWWVRMTVDPEIAVYEAERLAGMYPDARTELKWTVGR